MFLFLIPREHKGHFKVLREGDLNCFFSPEVQKNQYVPILTITYRQCKFFAKNLTIWLKTKCSSQLGQKKLFEKICWENQYLSGQIHEIWQSQWCQTTQKEKSTSKNKKCKIMQHLKSDRKMLVWWYWI